LATPAAVLLLFLISVSPAGAQAPYEPNDSLAQAWGPLAGGTDYRSTIETDNDQDWFYFYTSRSAQFDISFTGVTLPCDRGSYKLVDTDGNGVSSGSFYANLVDHVRTTLNGPARYFIAFSNAAIGCTVGVRIDPADAVTTNPPQPAPTPQPPGPAPQPAPAPNPGPPATDEAAIRCNTALRDVVRLTRRVGNDRRRVRAARTRQAKSRWRNRLRLDKASLREAQRRAGNYC
jgi:hypothetical protein